jgi:predicted metal-dependent phosphotriesterase family hydrolase
VNRIITVTGPLEPAELGATYAHEHLLGGPPDWSADRQDRDLTMLSVEAAVKELELFRMAGGRAIVEMSTPDYNRRPEQLRDLSKQSGVHVIMTTGVHKDAYSHPLTANASVDQLAANNVRDIMQGAGDTGVKAGVIKAATSLNQITEGEEKALRAAAQTHLETGAPISTHTQNGTMGLEQLAIFKGEGVDFSHVAIGHVDRKQEYDYHRALLDTGAYIIYDQISKEKYVPDRDRVATLVRLVSEGYGGQIMLAGDFGRGSYWTSNGGGPGLTYIIWRFVPWLISEGISRDAAWGMLITNPARFFAF